MIGNTPCYLSLSVSLIYLGYLTATASEDSELVLEVCERASASETDAKDAAKALRREFKCVTMA